MGQEEFIFTPSDKEEIDPLQADWEAVEDRASAIWTIPLRKRVCFRLKGLKDDFEGLIRLARRPKSLDPHSPLALRMKDLNFTNHEIESCVVIEQEEAKV